MDLYKDYKRVTIATPHRNDFTEEYLISLIQMMGHSKHILQPYFAKSWGVLDATRSMMLCSPTFECDFLLFIDSDAIFPPYALNQLVAHDKDIVSGVVYMGLYPHGPAVFKQHPTEGVMAHLWDMPGELFEVDACGAAFLMIKKTVIDKFKDPSIIEEYGSPFAPIGSFSEDISFCVRCRAMGFKIWVDPTIPLGHHKPMSINKETFEAVKRTRTDFAQLAIEDPDFARALYYPSAKEVMPAAPMTAREVVTW